MRYYLRKFFSWLASLFEVAPAAYIPPVEQKEDEKKEPEPQQVEKEDDASFAIYKPKERLIYQYYNGKEVVKADPMTLYKKVMDVGPEMAIHFKVAKSQARDAKGAHDALIGEVRKIFGIVSMEDDPDHGLPQMETMEVLDHFLTFIARVKKNSRTLPTPSAPSEDSTPTSEEGGPLTSSTSDFGSTESGSLTDAPRQSHSEPGSPLGL